MPLSGQVLVAVATAGLFGGLGIADGGIEPGAFSFAAVASWFAVVLLLALGGGLITRLPRGVYLGAALLFALALLAGLSATWSGIPGESVDIAVRSSLYVAVLLGAAVAVSAGAGRALLVGIALGGLAIVAVALGGRLIAGEIAPSDAAEIRTAAGGRLTSPVGYWNGLGATAGVTAVALIWFAAHGLGLGRRAATAALAAPALLALAMTSSRGAAVGVLGALAVLALASPSRGRVIGAALIAALAALPAFAAFRASSDLRLGLETGAADKAGIAVLALLGAAMLAAYLLSRRFEQRLAGWRPAIPGKRALAVTAVVCAGLLALAVATTAGDEDEVTIGPGEEAGQIARQSDSYRVSYWTSAIDAWRSEPILGVGAGGFHLWWIADPGEPQPVTHAHSLVFGPLAELGVVGLLLVLGFVALVAAVGVARLRSAASPEAQALVAAGLGLFVAVILPAFVDWTWSIPVAMTGLLAGAALVLALNGAPAGSRPITLALIVAALAGLAFSASTYLRVTEVENARAELAELDYAGAIDAAERADRWAPWSAEGVEHEAAALSADGRLGPAAARLREALDRAPEDWLLHFEAGRVADARGERRQARRFYREAERLNQFLQVEPLPADNRSDDRNGRGDQKRN